MSKKHNNKRPHTRHPAKSAGLAATLASVLLLTGSPLPLQAAPPLIDEPASDPHIGYGIHVAPWTPLSPSVAQNLGIDWVKIYNTDQIDDFPAERTLYRIEVRGLPGNISTNYETNMRNLAPQTATAGRDRSRSRK